MLATHGVCRLRSLRGDSAEVELTLEISYEGGGARILCASQRIVLFFFHNISIWFKRL